MLVTPWLRPLKSMFSIAHPSRSARRSKRDSVRPAVELLEDRTVPTGSWSAGASTLVPQIMAVGAVMADQFYLVGGSPGAPYGGATTAVEAYNPASNSWTMKGSDLVSRTNASAAVIGGNLYVVGGWLGSDSNVSTDQLTIYNPVTNSWSWGPSAGPVRGDTAGVAINDKLYVTGGRASYWSGDIGTLEIFDTVSQTWSTGAPMPSPRESARAAAWGGKMYVFGGYSNPYTPGGGTGTMVTTVDVYDPGTDSWALVAPMPTAVGLSGVTVLGDRIYVMGGWTPESGTLCSTVQVFDPASNTWSLEAPLLENNAGSVAGAINGQVFVAGGFRDGGYNYATHSLQIFTPTANQPPVLEAISARSVDELTPISFTVSASDPDGDSITLSASDLPAGASFNETTGVFTWTPGEEQEGTYNVTFTATDDGTPNRSDSETVVITVNEANDAPVASSDEYFTNEDNLLTVSPSGVLANDSDAEGDALTAVLVSEPGHGALTLNPDGSFSYMPDENYNGVDSFTYHASDGDLVSSDATVTIHVSAVNDAPSATDISMTMTTATLTIPVLDHATDVDGDTLSVLGVTNGANGIATLNPDGTVTYTLTRYFSGTDTFTYTVSDGHGGTATATVTIQAAVPANVGVDILGTQIDALSLGRGNKALLRTELALVDWFLERGRPRLAALQLRLFAAHVSVLERIGRLDAVTAALLSDQAAALIDAIV